jgi:hypothetical protein
LLYHFFPSIVVPNFRTNRVSGSIGVISWGGATIDLRRTLLIKAHGELRAKTRLDRSERRTRNIVSFVIAHVELANIVGIGAIRCLRFDINLPLAVESG